MLEGPASIDVEVSTVLQIAIDHRFTRVEISGKLAMALVPNLNFEIATLATWKASSATSIQKPTRARPLSSAHMLLRTRTATDTVKVCFV